MVNAVDRSRSILVAVATLLTIILNALAATGRINGVMTNEPSDRFPTVVTPAGFAFSIWALIYVGMIAFSIYQMLPNRSERVRGIRTAYLVSCVLNCAWIVAWHYYFLGVCTVLIVALAAVLTYIVFRLREPASSVIEALITKGTFGIYAGWVTAASLVNFVIFLKYSGVEMTSLGWNLIGIAALAIACAIAIVVRLKFNNYWFPISVAWAATGIGVQQSGNTAIVVATALTLIVGLLTAGSVVTSLKDASGE